MKRKFFFMAMALMLMIASCSPNTAMNAGNAADGSDVVAESEVVAQDPITVTVSILPQQYFVKRIGGDLVNVNVMVAPGQSPATYEPKTEQMVALSESAAYISIGVPFESAWLEKIQAANTDMKMVDTTEGIEKQYLREDVLDPHIWNSPALVKIQSENIYAALAEIDPDHADVYKENLDAFLADIDALDAEIKAALENTTATKFMVYHPAWGYFASDYGLEQIAVEVGGQEPSAQELADLITLAEEENIKVIFVQPEFSQEDAETIASEIGGEVLPISPLNPEWLDNMKMVAETFASVLNKESDSEVVAQDPITVTVSILPQQYFVKRIGGDLVNVNVMVAPGQSPATYEPKTEQMVALSESAAYISIGVPFESAWLEKIQAANTDMKMVDTTEGIEKQYLREDVLDPHIWNSPALVKIQSENIYAALAEIDPDHADVYKENLDAFLADIDALDAEIKAALENTTATKFMVYHPAWGYFASDYGLEQIAVEVGGQEPSAQELANLITLAEEENIKVIFVQPEFSQEDAETIASEIGGEVLPISPLNPEWLDNMKMVAETFASVLNQ